MNIDPQLHAVIETSKHSGMLPFGKITSFHVAGYLEGARGNEGPSGRKQGWQRQGAGRM